MRALIVDDEPLALIGLKSKIERLFPEVEVVDTYTDSSKAMFGVTTHRPDVVFLDIHMPETDGLELGRQIQAAAPGTEIVFVSGYDSYAVRAFELYALDYLLKPVQEERLRQTILRLQNKLQLQRNLNLQTAKNEADANRPLVCCFNRLQFKPPGKDATLVKWRTSKAQELFAYLLHHRNRIVSRGVLMDLLWPDLEEGKAAKQLYTTIYFIRQTLKQYGMDTISVQSGDLEAGYRLELGEARIDTEEWERDLMRLDVLDENTVETYEQVLNKYQGRYLASYDYIWAEHERERLRLLWLYNMRKVSDFYEQRGDIRKSIQICRTIQRSLPEEEETYLALMKLCDAIDDKIGVEEHYLLLKMKVERDLEMPISPEILQWYNGWRSKVLLEQSRH